MPTTKKKKQILMKAHLTKHKLILTPSGAQEAALCHIITHMIDGELTLNQLYEKTEECRLAWLNTELKHKI
jgi:hypothetical protein